MLDHHIQRSIVYTLAFADSLRFSQLQPDDIESKLFTYHLKKVIASGFVKKNDDGTYALTPEGRRIGKSVASHERTMDQAYSILLLVIRRKSDNAWLLYTRSTHPLIGLTGFMQAKPVASHPVADTAQKICFEKTGLQATFIVKASGYFRVYEGDELESFTNFTLLCADDASGELVALDEFGTYEWVQDPDFSGSDMLPTAETLRTLAMSNDVSFIEKTFHI